MTVISVSSRPASPLRNLLSVTEAHATRQGSVSESTGIIVIHHWHHQLDLAAGVCGPWPNLSSVPTHSRELITTQLRKRASFPAQITSTAKRTQPLTPRGIPFTQLEFRSHDSRFCGLAQTLYCAMCAGCSTCSFLRLPQAHGHRPDLYRRSVPTATSECSPYSTLFFVP